MVNREEDRCVHLYGVELRERGRRMYRVHELRRRVFELFSHRLLGVLQLVQSRRRKCRRD